MAQWDTLLRPLLSALCITRSFYFGWFGNMNYFQACVISYHFYAYSFLVVLSPVSDSFFTQVQVSTQETQEDLV